MASGFTPFTPPQYYGQPGQPFTPPLVANQQQDKALQSQQQQQGHQLPQSNFVQNGPVQQNGYSSSSIGMAAYSQRLTMQQPHFTAEATSQNFDQYSHPRQELAEGSHEEKEQISLKSVQPMPSLATRPPADPDQQSSPVHTLQSELHNGPMKYAGAFDGEKWQMPSYCASVSPASQLTGFTPQQGQNYQYQSIGAPPPVPLPTAAFQPGQYQATGQNYYYANQYQQQQQQFSQQNYPKDSTNANVVSHQKLPSPPAPMPANYGYSTAQPQRSPIITQTGQYHHQQSLANATRDLGRIGFPQPLTKKPDLFELIQKRDHGLDTVAACPEPEIKLPPTLVINPSINCDSNIMRSTLSAVPRSSQLLKSCRLPFAITLHPFRDMTNLNVINTNMIVRCRTCRTYINPFVQFPNQRNWKCNLCFRTNELSEEFYWDPTSKSFGDPMRRPEIQLATVEFIAPAEYTLRPPQPAVYLYIFDVSAEAIESGYLHAFSDQFLINLDQIPGDKRTLIGFMAVDSCVHFFQFFEDSPNPKQITCPELEDVEIPVPDGLLLRISKNKDKVRFFVQNLPTIFEKAESNSNALGSALKYAHQMISEIGGRITVIQATLPDMGPGALHSREDPNMRAGLEVQNLGPATDFYKKLALDCTANQVSIDLFLLNSKYADLTTLGEAAKFSAGSVHHFGNYHLNRNQLQVKRFQKILCRYLIRKIGFESVLRIRCTKGLSLKKFRGHFFVRSTDLLAMANVNPDSALAAEVEIVESLEGLHTVAFQSALLYTSSKGDRRIRVHTLCLPVTNDLMVIYRSVDIRCLVSILAKMAVERSTGSEGSIGDAREALVNACVDAWGAFAQQANTANSPQTVSPLVFLPFHVLGLLKHIAFILGRSVKLDERAAAMCMFETGPIELILLEIYPNLYPLHTIDKQEDEPKAVALSYEKVDGHGVYLLDTGSYLYIYVGQAVSDVICQQLFNVPFYKQIDQDSALPELETALSERVRRFIRDLTAKRPFYPPTLIIRDDSSYRDLFIRRLIEDKTESTFSLLEFLQLVRREIHA